MKLTEVEIFNFQSIHHSGPVRVGAITCLIGKNEAGKTALLQALYRLNPILESDSTYDYTEDFPRAALDDYEYAVESGERKPAKVVCAAFDLEPNDLESLHQEFGPDVLSTNQVTLWNGYSNKRTFRLEVNETNALQHFLARAQLSSDTASEFSNCKSFLEVLELARTNSSSEEIDNLIRTTAEIQDVGLDRYIYLNHIRPKVPKFVYFDEFYLMNGYENLEALQQRARSGELRPSDFPMLGLIQQARLHLDQLLNPKRTQQLVNKLEGAGFHLSKKMLKYWSQNQHLKIRFDVRPGHPGDPEGMREGTNIWAGIYDSKHMVSTHLGERSKGFLWFFSFLAWYAQLQTSDDPLILLLDEPGMSLHAKAQQDLLRYFDDELAPNHQLIYTSHSPFMVDRKHMGRVRIVEDESPDVDEGYAPDTQGTKVLSDFSKASSDSLFPLLGALGYDIYDSLFAGRNSLVVEDIAELLYFQAMSDLVEEDGRPGLSPEWTITPVSGIDQIITFISLLSSRQDIKLATLLGANHQDEKSEQDPQTKRLLRKGHILRFADFAITDEADMEDMFETDFYLRLVNAAYENLLQKPVSESELSPSTSPILLRLQNYFHTYPLQHSARFSRFRVARYLVANVDSLKPHLSKQTRDRFANVFLWANSLL
ncbi:MAG: AAA family ATPase [Gammaproteobacteria bacterium]|nr:AAA family ATPase [Gammaproteobacteria bacterium]